jgi:hypothetical protein
LEGRKILSESAPFSESALFTERWTNRGGSVPTPSLRNNFATMARNKIDRSRWHQQDRDVEEVRCGRSASYEGTSQMRKRSRLGVPELLTTGSFFIHNQQTGDW